MRQVRLALVAACLSGIFSHSVHAAVYEVVEIPTQNIALNSFAASINDTGDIALVTTGVFNPPIDLSLLDFESEILINGLTDLEGAQNGNFNAEDLTFISSFIAGQVSNTGQQIASSQSYLANAGTLSGDDIVFIPAFDEVDPDLNSFTRSIDTRVREVNNQGVMVGTSEGKFGKVVYTNEAETEITYTLQSFGQRGFVSIGGTNYGLEPGVETVGAISEGFDVNNNLLVAGYETLDPTEARVTAEANCQDDEVRGDIPVELCLQNLINAGVLSAFQLRGALWQFNEQGEVLSKESLGLHITPEEDDTRVHISRALSVNDNGVAVGEATDFYQDDEDRPRTFAAIFQNGEVTGFTDHEEYFNSIAIAINNNNLVIGQATKNISGFSRTKFFIYDIDSETTTFPEDFFPGSASVARAINENNLVVGEGEVDASFNVPRRGHGFLYDIEAGTFQDLNDLVSCTSPYTIVQANSINSSNQIAATAIVHRQVFDILGEGRVDDNGDPVTEDLIVSVLLDPVTNGQIDDCNGEEPPPEEENQERSSGSFAWFSLFIGMMVIVRRRFQK